MIDGAKPQSYIVHPLPDPKIQNLLSIYHERLEGFYPRVVKQAARR